MLVRFVGAALIGWTAVEIALYLVICRQKNLPVGVLACVIRSLPLLLGSVVLVKSKSLANWVSDKLDL